LGLAGRFAGLPVGGEVLETRHDRRPKMALHWALRQMDAAQYAQRGGIEWFAPNQMGARKVTRWLPG